MPFVSIIIPNYNHVSFLKQRIDSVLEQTFQDFELIILDDCSLDNSKEIIESYRNNPKISHIIYNEKNSGSTFDQWRKGVELAKAEWVWIAESDDWAEKTFLQEMKTFTENVEVDLAYCESYFADEKGEKKGLVNWARMVEPEHWERDFINSGKEEITNYLFYRNTIPNASAVLVKKNILQSALESFPFQFRYAGDWYIWVKCVEAGNVAFLNQPLNYFRQHKQTTRSKKSDSEERKRLKEYFYIINYIKGKFSPKLNLEKHIWIVNEWAGKKFLDDKIKNIFFPPLPIVYYFAYYKIAIIGKLLVKLKIK